MSGLLNRLGSKSVKFDLEILIHSVKLEKKQPCLIKIRANRGKKKQQETQSIQYHPSSKQLQLSQIFNFSCTLYKKNEKYLKKEFELKVLELQGKSELTLGKLTIDFHSIAEKKTTIAFQEFPLKDSKDTKAKLCISINLSERSPKKIPKKEEKKMTLNSVRRAFSVDETESLKLRQELESEQTEDFPDIQNKKVEIKTDMTRKGSEKTLRKAFCEPDSEENVYLVKSIGGDFDEKKVNKVRFASIRGGFGGLEAFDGLGEFKDSGYEIGIGQKHEKTGYGVKETEGFIEGEREINDNWKKVETHRSSSSSSIKSLENEKKNNASEKVVNLKESVDSQSSDSQKSVEKIKSRHSESSKGKSSEENVVDMKTVKHNEDFGGKSSDEIVKEEQVMEDNNRSESMSVGSIKSRNSESSKDKKSGEVDEREQSLKDDESVESKKSKNSVERIKSRKSESSGSIEEDKGKVSMKDSNSSESEKSFVGSGKKKFDGSKKSKKSSQKSKKSSQKSKESSTSSKNSKGSGIKISVKNPHESEIHTEFEGSNIAEIGNINNLNCVEVENVLGGESIEYSNHNENKNIVDSESLKSVNISGSKKSKKSNKSPKKSKNSGSGNSKKDVSEKSIKSSKNSKNSEGGISSSKKSIESEQSIKDKDIKINVHESENKIKADGDESSVSDSSSESDKKESKFNKTKQIEEKTDDFKALELSQRKYSDESNKSEKNKNTTSNNVEKNLLELRKNSESEESIKSSNNDSSSKSNNSINKISSITPSTNKINNSYSPNEDFQILSDVCTIDPDTEIINKNSSPAKTEKIILQNPKDLETHSEPLIIPPSHVQINPINHEKFVTQDEEFSYSHYNENPKITSTGHQSEKSDSSSSKSSDSHSSSINSPKRATKSQLNNKKSPSDSEKLQKAENESKVINSQPALIKCSFNTPNPEINEAETPIFPSNTLTPEGNKDEKILKNEKKKLKNEKKTRKEKSDSSSDSSSKSNEDLFEKEFFDSSSSVEETGPDIQIPVTDLKETIPNSASQELVLNLKEKESGLPESRNTTCCGSCSCF